LFKHKDIPCSILTNVKFGYLTLYHFKGNHKLKKTKMPDREQGTEAKNYVELSVN